MEQEEQEQTQRTRWELLQERLFGLLGWSPGKLCIACDGYGLFGGGGRPSSERGVCGHCDGTGLEPQPALTWETWHEDVVPALVARKLAVHTMEEAGRHVCRIIRSADGAVLGCGEESGDAMRLRGLEPSFCFDAVRDFLRD